ncbi:hypothetical protein AX16_005846 [Volvariella volvacea WC 439]|nr:hypothetical protein AX16_005846 [Volvariella volvacea WC 439]
MASKPQGSAKTTKKRPSSPPRVKRPLSDLTNQPAQSNFVPTSNRPAPEHYDELRAIWEADKRIPTVKSRRKWCEARNIGTQAVNRWWSRRKQEAKKVGITIPDETYELPVGTPPVIEEKPNIKQEPESIDVVPPKRKKKATKAVPKPTKPGTRMVTRSRNLKMPSDDDHTALLLSSDDAHFSEARGSSVDCRSRAYSHLNSSPAPQDPSSSPRSDPLSDELGISTPRLYMWTPPSSPLPQDEADVDKGIVCNQGHATDAPGFTCPLCIATGIWLFSPSSNIA